MKTTSKLLFNEEPITINRTAARVLGLNEAIVVQQVHYWLEINRKSKINFHDGRTWTYNTYDKWQQENFDFWSVKTVRRIFDSLEKKEIIVKGNYNKAKYDRTLWVSINYDKLDEILDEYESKNTTNVEIQTKGQNDHMSNSNIRTNCPHGKGQNDHMEKDKMTSPIPKTNTKTSSEITTEPTQNVSVVETNKELIESKTHLLLDSKNKKDKVAKWNKDRLLKSIDIFVEQGGQYFSLLEKIYKDDKNFAPEAIKAKKPLTRFHNINDSTKKYTAEELEKLLRENQKRKFKSDNVVVEDEAVDVAVESIKDLADKCRMNPGYFESLSGETKDAVREYANDNFMFVPMHMR